MLGVPDEVVADVEVEVAVVVEVGKGGRGRPVAIAPQAGPIGDVLERPVAAVAIERVGSPAGDEEVGMAVVVDVADGHAVPVASLHPADAGSVARIVKRAVALVPKQSIARVGPVGPGREDASLDDVDIEPAIAVVVEQTNPAGHRLGNLAETRASIVEGESKAGLRQGRRNVASHRQAAAAWLADGFAADFSSGSRSENSSASMVVGQPGAVPGCRASRKPPRRRLVSTGQNELAATTSLALRNGGPVTRPDRPARRTAPAPIGSSISRR